MRLLTALLLILVSQQALTRDLTPSEKTCLQQIREEADFILSRINVVHQEYENKVQQAGLADFKSGKYSTIELLDNTIRKYHRDLVKKVRAYPFSYKARMAHSSQSSRNQCMAENLQAEAVGTIHEFELSWQKAIQQAEKNASYFRRVDGMN